MPGSCRRLAGSQLGIAELRQGIAGKAAAEQQQAEGVFGFEQAAGGGQAGARVGGPAQPPRHDAATQPRHGEGRIEVGGDVVVADRFGESAPAFMTQRQQVVGLGAKIAGGQQRRAIAGGGQRWQWGPATVAAGARRPACADR